MKINILTTENSHFVSYANQLCEQFRAANHESSVFFDHKNLSSGDRLFILSYFRIIPPEFLEYHPDNVVIHASDLPLGRGWSPMAHQIAAGENQIVFSALSASEGVDEGPVYLKRMLQLGGTELLDEWKHLQNQFCVDIAFELGTARVLPELTPQTGEATYYPRRTFADDQLDPNKTLVELFNQLRVANSEEFPSWFEINGERFYLKISKVS